MGVCVNIDEPVESQILRPQALSSSSISDLLCQLLIVLHTTCYLLPRYSTVCARTRHLISDARWASAVLYLLFLLLLTAQEYFSIR